MALSLIRQLQCSKSPGPDKVPVKVKKDAIDAISLPLALIFNSSAKVTPILKSGQRTKVNNYRPIFVLSVFLRLLEKIVHDQIYAFVREHKIMSANQYAFQKRHNTVSSLINWSKF